MAKITKERIDIEALLTWAFRDQCIDRVARAAFSVRGPSGDANGAAMQMMQLGCRVSTSSHAEMVMGAKAPEDAFILHDAVLTLGDMFIDTEGGVWTGERAARIGMRIERDGKGWWLFDPVAQQGCPLSQAGAMALVIIHAKNGTRPECYPHWRPPVGRPAADAAGQDQRGRTRRAKEGPDAEEVAFYRAVYAVWRASLVVLVDDLAGALAGYEVTGPAVPAEPWAVRGGRAGSLLNRHNSDGVKSLSSLDKAVA